tara:strand:- start:1479 stop:1862 length:384 start_codon:yes stop_codon:yes gene_type:complete
MASNSTEVIYGFGQMGSIFNDNTTPVRPPVGKVIVAVTFITDTKLESHGGLVAANDNNVGLGYVSTENADGSTNITHDENYASETITNGSGQVNVNQANSFPRGLTIYGRWNEVHAVSGTFIAYIGE